MMMLTFTPPSACLWGPASYVHAFMRMALHWSMMDKVA